MAKALPSKREPRETQARLEEQERGERRVGKWQARLTVGSDVVPCLVSDLSIAGAKLRLVATIHRLQEVRLELDGIAPLDADVMWRTRSNIGIRFTDDPAYVAQVLKPLLVLGWCQRS